MQRLTRARIGGLVAIAGLAACAATNSEAAATKEGSGSLAAAVDLPFRKFVLANGLTLVVHEDRKAPIVAVNVWYHVGSKNERPGRTGLAHLFEHLMFQGSENQRGEVFQTLEQLGATVYDGTTNNDRTNYFETVPVNALDRVLWLESDRMGHLLGAIDQAQLDEQRGVVQNEKRQMENQAYGLSYGVIAERTAPQGHPYSWTVIGSMTDLDAASLDDAREWFRTWYGAANATLVVAGDIDAEDVKTRVEQWFGDLPSGPPVTRPRVWIAPLAGTQRETLQDRVTLPRLVLVWNVAPWGDPSLEPLGLFADLLAGGKTSRLHQRLVMKEQVASAAYAFVNRRELGSQFWIQVNANPGVDLRAVERTVDEELARLLADGPSAAEVARVQTQQLAGALRGLERIGGFGGKSDVLAESEVFGGDPGLYRQRLVALEGATPATVVAAARAAFVGRGRFILDVVPFPKFTTTAQAVDRARGPEPGAAPDARFPAVARTRLENGLELLVAERHGTPVVELRLLVACGSAADPPGAPGTAALALNLLDEGTRTLDATQLGERAESLGARLATGVSLDTASLSLSALTQNLDASLDLFADVLLEPAFPAADLERLRKETLVALQQSKVEPNAMGRRVLPRLLYGAGHPYGQLGGGAGTEESLAQLTREQVVAWYSTWIKPDHATLIVVGDTTLGEIRPRIEQRLARWRRGAVPPLAIAAPAPVARPLVYLIDRPGALQSVLLAATIAPQKEAASEPAVNLANRILGGQFSSRLNMNLREDKHWSYGARSALQDARGPRLFVVSAPVQTDKTRESLLEVKKELDGILGTRAITDLELATAQAQETLALTGKWETSSALLASLADLVQYGLPDDYWTAYSSKVRALTAPTLLAAVKTVIDPNRIVWIVVGDRSKIESGVRASGLGEVRPIDADGQPVGPKSSP